ncbi:GCG_CRPN prefix-to-repeats domain-containing protein [Sphingomonas sp.]|uniref:GCG_CRPN prefix-to-repeats domain-containing protein n=1 Tax=Sphingomonas sp. TaxID=28214 RepID=UPI003CC5F51A
MKTIIAAAPSVGTGLAAASPGAAADGCGRGGHRGPYGRCRPNRDPALAAAPGVRLVIGNRYDRGYWAGHRYWRHRERRRGGCRYR